MTDVTSAAMAGTARVAANSAEEAQALVDHAAKVNEAERNWAKLDAAEKLPTINTASTATVTFSGGKVIAQSGRPVSVQTPTRDVPKGMIRLPNGMVTTIEAAEAAGFIIADEQRRGPVASFDGGASGALPETPKGNAQGNPNATEQAADAAPEGSTITVTTEAAAAISACNQAIEVAGKAIGNTAVMALQHDVVARGTLPTELPSGISAEMVNAVAAGYVAQANAVLKETGATVDGLVKMLNPSELKQARVAAFQNDDARLKELGHRAMSRLQSLPDDPVLLKELTADWPAEFKVMRRNNVAWVETPGWKMPWAEAVRSKKIWLGS